MDKRLSRVQLCVLVLGLLGAQNGHILVADADAAARQRPKLHLFSIKVVNTGKSCFSPVFIATHDGSYDITQDLVALEYTGQAATSSHSAFSSIQVPLFSDVIAAAEVRREGKPHNASNLCPDQEGVIKFLYDSSTPHGAHYLSFMAAIADNGSDKISRVYNMDMRSYPLFDSRGRRVAKRIQVKGHGVSIGNNKNVMTIRIGTQRQVVKRRAMLKSKWNDNDVNGVESVPQRPVENSGGPKGSASLQFLSGSRIRFHIKASLEHGDFRTCDLYVRQPSTQDSILIMSLISNSGLRHSKRQDVLRYSGFIDMPNDIVIESESETDDPPLTLRRNEDLWFYVLKGKVSIVVTSATYPAGELRADFVRWFV